MPEQKAQNEMYCQSCGSIIKRKAEICPECGVRNKESTQSQTQSNTTTSHDPTQYETTVSDTWYLGVVAGIVLWIVTLAFAGVEPTGALEAFMGFLALVAWAVMPVAIYYDAKYVRSNSQWNPNTVAWVVVSVIWVVNIIAGAVYLYRRHEVLGKP